MARKIDWPDWEPIPNTLEEALANGYEIIGSEDQTPEEEGTQTGYTVLEKKIRNVQFTLEVPFVAKYTFDRPGTPRAVEFTSDDIQAWDW